MPAVARIPAAAGRREGPHRELAEPEPAAQELAELAAGSPGPTVAARPAVESVGLQAVA